MSFQFVERQKMQRTVWGSAKVRLWDFLAGLLAFFEIELGQMPEKWRNTK